MQRTTKDIVKNKLWGFGYRVRDYKDLMGGEVPFDLIVWNEKKRFLLKTGEKIPKKKDLALCDIFACNNTSNTNKDGKITFYSIDKEGKIKGSKSPYAFFGKPKKQVDKAKIKNKLKIKFYAKNTKRQNDKSIATG